jgi:NOL1/NOP2/fmu family ribosome biogenesis protein
MKINILSRAKKKKFIEGLNELGIKKIPQMLVRSGKERIRAFSGDLDREQIMNIWNLLPIEGIGLYVGKDMVNRNGVREVRLSLDGMHIWKRQLTERVLSLNKEQEKDWFLGRDIELNEEQKVEEGFVNVKSGSDFVGIGKVGADGYKLFSFLPKERRRKERMN